MTTKSPGVGCAKFVFAHAEKHYIRKPPALCRGYIIPKHRHPISPGTCGRGIFNPQIYCAGYSQFVILNSKFSFPSLSTGNWQQNAIRNSKFSIHNYKFSLLTFHFIFPSPLVPHPSSLISAYVIPSDANRGLR